jgi:hypothetical protein
MLLALGTTDKAVRIQTLLGAQLYGRRGTVLIILLKGYFAAPQFAEQIMRR